jgi:hypothetical protein
MFKKLRQYRAQHMDAKANAGADPKSAAWRSRKAGDEVNCLSDPR